MIKNSTWHFRHILGPSFTQQNNFDYLNRFMKFCIPSRILLWSPVPQEHLTVLIIYPKFGQGDKSWFVPRCKSNSCCHHWIWSHIGLSIEIRKVTSVWAPPARPPKTLLKTFGRVSLWSVGTAHREMGVGGRAFENPVFCTYNRFHTEMNIWMLLISCLQVPLGAN